MNLQFYLSGDVSKLSTRPPVPPTKNAYINVYYIYIHIHVVFYQRNLPTSFTTPVDFTASPHSTPAKNPMDLPKAEVEGSIEKLKKDRYLFKPIPMSDSSAAGFFLGG